MQTADQVLQEELEGLRQAEHRFVANYECGDLLTPVLHQLALIGTGIRGGDRRR